MFVYFNSQGVIKEIINDEAIRQGNSNVNSIFFFIEPLEPSIDPVNGAYEPLIVSGLTRTFYDENGDIVGAQDVSFDASIHMKEIPFDKKRELNYFQYYQKYKMYKLEITDDVLNEAGVYACKIKAIQLDSTQTVLGPLVFNVELTSGNQPIISPDTAITIAQWNYLVAKLESYVGKVSTPNIVYGTNGGGTQVNIPYTQSAIENTIPLRSGSGQLSVPTTPVANTDAASKAYADRTNYLLDAIYYADDWFVGRNTLYVEPQNGANLVLYTGNQSAYLVNNKKDIVIANEFASDNVDESGIELFNGIRIHSATQNTTQHVVIRSEDSTTTKSSVVYASPTGLQLDSSEMIYLEAPQVGVYMDTETTVSVGGIRITAQSVPDDGFTRITYNIGTESSSSIKNCLSITDFYDTFLDADNTISINGRHGLELDGNTSGIMFSAGQMLYPECDGASVGDEVDIGGVNGRRFRNICGINLYGDQLRLDNSTLIDENDNRIYFGQTNTSEQSYVMATQDYVMDYVASQLGGVYKPQGSSSVSGLNSLTKTAAMNGYVYNVTDSGSLTNSDSSTLSVNQGDNVVLLWNNGSWYWDDLAGLVDLSNYYTKSEADNKYVGLTGNQLIAGDKKFTGTGYFYNICLPQNVNNPNELSLILRRSTNNPTWELEAKDYHGQNSNILTINETNILMESDLLFNSNNANDIGSSSAKVKDIYVAGSLKDGTSSVSVDNIVTTNTAQTIGGVKTFSNGFNIGSEIKVYDAGSGISFVNTTTTPPTPLFSINEDKTIYLYGNVRLSNDKTISIGTSTSKLLKEVFTDKVTDASGSYSSANTFNVINASDISNNTLTQAQYDLITNGKPTLIKGTIQNYDNPFLFPTTSANNCVGRFIAQAVNSVYGKYAQYQIDSTTKVITLDTGRTTHVMGIWSLNGKTLPNYPSSPTVPQAFIYDTDNNLKYIDTHKEWYGTQAQYDNLSTYDSNTLYYIEEE